MFYRLEKPDLTKIDKVKVFDIFQKHLEIFDYLYDTFSPYAYWDKIKYKKIPDYISHEEFWWLVKIIRNLPSFKNKNFIIENENGEHFVYMKLPGIDKFLHEMDLDTGGVLVGEGKDLQKINNQKLISRGIIEEAIASSQLEGANTTRKLAKQFLREGRKPKNKAEQMILNNYTTMQLIEESYKNKKLNEDLLFELHGLITKNTIPENEVGRFRKDEEEIIVGNQEDVIYHGPPKIDFVKKEIKKFIKFANDELREPFIHPIIKAIMIHFWVGYLHPFTDGNGRLARLLFYWYLLRNNYWAFAYLPISLMIKKSPQQYMMAYVYSEQDDLDLTYFIDYNIEKIKLALANFKEYIKKQIEGNQGITDSLRVKYNLNDRQIQLLRFYNENKNASTILKVYKNINKISKKTAIKDLKQLTDAGFLIRRKQGRKIYYYATENVSSLFA
ncbi:MAG: Fic family protein [Armatimonadota bacterium]